MVEHASFVSNDSSVAKTVWYGVGRAVENQLPHKHKERILKIIDEKIVPKLSPAAQETVKSLRMTIELGAAVAGTAITASEIFLATVAGVYTMRFAGNKFFDIARKNQKKERGGERRMHRSNRRAQNIEWQVDDSHHVNMLMDIQAEIDEQSALGKKSPWASAFRDQLKALEEKGNTVTEKNLAAMLRKTTKRLKELGIEEPAPFKRVKGHELSDNELAQISALTSNIRTRKKDQGYEAKRRFEQEQKEKERARTMALAKQVRKGVTWQNPELVGTLEKVRRQVGANNMRQQYELARMLDDMPKFKKDDHRVNTLLSKMFMAKRLGARDELVSLSTQLFEVVNRTFPLDQARIATSATYWGDTLRAAGLEVMLPNGPDHTVARTYLQEFFTSHTPQYLISLLTTRLSRAAAYDPNIYEKIHMMRRRLPDLPDAEEKIKRQHAIRELLESGYRLLINTQSEKQRANELRMRMQSAKGPLSEHRLSRDESDIIQKLMTWVTDQTPERAFAPLLSQKKFSEHAYEKYQKQEELRLEKLLDKKRKERAQNEKKLSGDLGPLRDYAQEDKDFVTNQALINTALLSWGNPEVERLLHEIRNHGEWELKGDAKKIPTPKMVDLMALAYRQREKIPDGQSLNDVQVAEVNRLSEQYVNDGAPGLDVLYRFYPYNDALNKKK